MTSDPKNVNPSVLPQAPRPATGGSAGSGSRASTPAPGLTTGEPDRVELADKGAAKRLDLTKPAGDKSSDSHGGEGHKEPHVDAPKVFTDNRPRTAGSDPAQPQPQPVKQGQPNPQRPTSSPQPGAGEHAGADKTREAKPGTGV